MLCRVAVHSLLKCRRMNQQGDARLPHALMSNNGNEKRWLNGKQIMKEGFVFMRNKLKTFLRIAQTGPK